MTHETSLSLLDRLKDSSNEKEWGLFVELYRPFLCRYLAGFSICPEDAEDVSQEALVATYRALPAFRHNGRVGSFRRWFRTIVHQRALNYLRNKRHQPTLVGASYEDALASYESTSNSLEEEWEREHDQFVLSRLLTLIEPEFTKTTWEAFYRQVIDGQIALDVGKSLGISANAALIAKSRVLRRLREISAGLVDDWNN